MNKTVKKIWDGITTVLVALVVVLAVLLVGVRVVGMQVFTVLSGSMEPSAWWACRCSPCSPAPWSPRITPAL